MMRSLPMATLMALFPGAALAGPANQTCDTAMPVGFPSVTLDSTLGALVETASSSCARGDVYGAWFSLVAPAQGRYLFVAEGLAGLSDTTLSFRTDCMLPETACVDDTFTSLVGSGYVDLNQGDQVFVRVAGWGETRGDFRLVVDHPENLARPVNDECVAAIPLASDHPIPTSTLFATGVDSSSCGSDDSSDLWYTFTAPIEDDYDFFITQNQLSATLLSIQTGCGTGELACGLAGASAHLLEGQMVYVRVGTNPNAADTFNVNVGPTERVIPPPNDTFDTALPITVPSTVSGTTNGATQEGLNFGPTCGPFVNAAVWYSFTATAAGVYVFDTNGSAMDDTVIGVFGPCPASGGPAPQLLTCDDDTGEGRHSRVSGLLAAGESICLAVGGRYLSEHGNFILNASARPPRPLNDHCVTAAPLGFPDLVVAENFGSDPEPSTFPCPNGNFALWYSFTAPAAGLYKFDTKATVEAQPDLALYSSCGTTPIACGTNPNPVVSAELAAGETVLVRASSDVFTWGAIALRVGPERPIAPPLDAGVFDSEPLLDATPLDATPPDSTADASPIDASPVDAGSVADAGAPSPELEASDCGCSSVPKSAAGRDWVVLGLVAASWSRRLRRRKA